MPKQVREMATPYVDEKKPRVCGVCDEPRVVGIVLKVPFSKKGEVFVCIGCVCASWNDE